MKIVILGAAGRTGRLLVKRALEAGHEVTAAARRPEAIQAGGARLSRRRCDLFDPRSTAEAIAGHECILSAVGATQATAPTTVFSTGIKHILAGARSAKIKRIIVLSSAGVDPHTLVLFHIKLFADLVIRPLLFGIYVDSARMEGMLEASDCDWTVMRPPRLTNGAPTTDYRISIGKHLRNMASVSREDLADSVMRMISDSSSYRSWVEVAGNAWF